MLAVCCHVQSGWMKWTFYACTDKQQTSSTLFVFCFWENLRKANFVQNSADVWSQLGWKLIKLLHFCNCESNLFFLLLLLANNSRSDMTCVSVRAPTEDPTYHNLGDVLRIHLVMSLDLLTKAGELTSNKWLQPWPGVRIPDNRLWMEFCSSSTNYFAVSQYR